MTAYVGHWPQTGHIAQSRKHIKVGPLLLAWLCQSLCAAVGWRAWDAAGWCIGTSRSLPGWPRLGQGAQFAGKVGGFGRPDPLEDLQRLPQLVVCLGGVAGGKSAPAQASQRVGLIPGAADLAGQAQRLPMA